MMPDSRPPASARPFSAASPWLILLAGLVILTLCTWAAYHQTHQANQEIRDGVGAQGPSASVTAEPHFAPGTDCTETAVAQLDAAKKTVLVQAYGFTSPAIAEALVAAKRRGVDVQVVLDRSDRTARNCQAPALAKARISILYDAHHPIAHNKVIICDGRTVLTGSFNFTEAAQRNAENLVVLKSAELAREYGNNWVVHASHSER